MSGDLSPESAECPHAAKPFFRAVSISFLASQPIIDIQREKNKLIGFQIQSQSIIGGCSCQGIRLFRSHAALFEPGLRLVISIMKTDQVNFSNEVYRLFKHPHSLAPPDKKNSLAPLCTTQSHQNRCCSFSSGGRRISSLLLD